MTIVNPLIAANLAVHSATTANRPEERQHNLQVNQIVQATVADGGLDRATLEFNLQRFLMDTEQELQTGQQLKLQVLTTHPRLTFKILSPPFESRLKALLPLLASPFDWHGFLQQMQKGSARQAEPARRVMEQLSEMLRPAADLPARELTEVAVSLGQLRRSEPLFAVKNGPALASAFDRVISTLNQRAETLDLPQQLKLIALQIRQQPEFMQHFMVAEKGKVADLLARLEQPQRPLDTLQAHNLAMELKTLLVGRSVTLRQSFDEHQARDLTNNLKNLPVNKSSVLPISQPLTQVSQKLGQLLNQGTTTEFELTPELLGQLKTMVGELQVAATGHPNWSPALQQVVQQVLGSLTPVLAMPEVLTQGQSLGLFSQLFGLNLETELLRGQSRDALTSLKLALFEGYEKLGPKGEEALHRLELFQVCRVRLADQNLQFLPLPLPFLEEGFMLVDEESRGDVQKTKAGASHMSLHLRLSALGNLRIDILNEPSGMLLRIACEDQQRATYLQTISQKLQARLKDLPVRGISFTTGVESPACALIEKLVPRSQGMLDARV